MQAGGPATISILNSLTVSVVRPHQLSLGVVRDLHAWVEREVAPALHIQVDSFASFQRRLQQRLELVVATEICSNPPLTFFHIPALHSCEEIVADSSLVCSFRERFEVNPSTGARERAFRHWCDSEKMREVCRAVGNDNVFVAFAAFIDDTSVVEYRGRSVTPLMLVPLNVDNGQFDVVGFVPYVSEEEALRAGVKKSHIPLFRSLILQHCISVVLLYGAFREDSPSYLAERNGVPTPVRNILVSLRVDHKARLEALALVPISRVVDRRYPACRRHEIPCQGLGEIVEDCDRSMYNHGLRYRSLWEKLLQDLQVPDTKKEAASRLVDLGQRPIRPALFDAYLFDGAVDTPEDIHHVGPLGIAQFLLSKLPLALKDPFPVTPAQGHACCDIFPESQDGGPFLQLDKGDDVTWIVDDAEHVKAGHVWATVVGTRNSGFVPIDCLKTDRQHNYDWLYALEQIDEALRRSGTAYVRSYKRFDFPSLSDLVDKWRRDDDGEVDVFSRATVTETAVLFITYALPSILPARGFEWITRTFLLYNKLYWSWRREVCFASDFAILNKHRIEWKQLMREYWARFSKSNLCTSKFHAFDHITLDISRHSVPRYTGSGPGDHAHIAKAKKPFKMSSKSKNQNQLNKQLVEFGYAAPSFVQARAAKSRAGKKGSLQGKGRAELLNHYVVRQVRSLRNVGWATYECNMPVRALESLRELCQGRFGLSEDLTEFSQRKILLFHSARLASGVVVYASDSFHGAARHDFLLLKNKNLVRAVALIQLSVFGVKSDFALVEKTRWEDVEQLRVLQCSIVSEADEWYWVGLSEIDRPVTALPHSFDRAWHFLIREKNDERVWK